ncbi:MAG: BrnT family toxin [Acidobacteria bacterium]|nr:BrnT family toxin [Acidobacteriota bacterium]
MFAPYSKLRSLSSSAEERRFVIIGMSEKGRMVIVAHTVDGEIVRLISAREPTRVEREFYEES